MMKLSRFFVPIAFILISVVIFIVFERSFRKPDGCFLGKTYDLHLTFDDGPVLTHITEDILEILKKRECLRLFLSRVP